MKWLYAVLAVLAIVLIAAGAALGWLVGTEAGLLWAAAQVADKVSVEGLRGRLAGEIAFDKLTYGDEGLRVEARDANLRPHLAALLGGRLTIEPLHAASLQIDLLPSDTPPATAAPKLPLRLHLGQARVDEIVVRRGFRPMIVRQVTLLPEPDSPTIPSVWPFSIENDTPSTAPTTPSSVWKDVRRSFTSSSATCVA